MISLFPFSSQLFRWTHSISYLPFQVWSLFWSPDLLVKLLIWHFYLLIWFHSLPQLLHSIHYKAYHFYFKNAPGILLLHPFPLPSTWSKSPSSLSYINSTSLFIGFLLFTFALLSPYNRQRDLLKYNVSSSISPYSTCEKKNPNTLLPSVRPLIIWL